MNNFTLIKRFKFKTDLYELINCLRSSLYLLPYEILLPVDKPPHSTKVQNLSLQDAGFTQPPLDKYAASISLGPQTGGGLTANLPALSAKI